jgi:hypothetical protein
MNTLLFRYLAYLMFVLIPMVQLYANQQIVSLNGNWSFKADYYDKGEQQHWFSTSLNDAEWDKMPVPGNWDLRNEYASYTGKAWYRRNFTTPQYDSDKIVRLQFEAVGIDYKVWLNGELISTVVGGYFPNTINITDKLKSGQQNQLAVCVDNSFRSGAYWSWGGIRRPVQLLINNPVYIDKTHIQATPDLKKGTAEVAVTTIIHNSKLVSKKGVLEYELYYDGKMIRKARQPIELSGANNQQSTFKIALAKKDVKLWHFDFPHLYTLRINLTENNKITHQISERFGIRKVEIANQKFLLNGEEIRAMGLNWVADDRLTGNTLPPDMFKQHIDNMKMLGVNLSRLSHVPLTKEIYDYLDEKGMMIIAEIPAWGITPLAHPDNPIPFSWIKQMIHEAYNHPSIIGWCVGNEIGYLHHNTKIMQYVEKSIRFVKDSLDNSRLVVMVTHSASQQPDDPSKFSDFVPNNSYGGWGWDLDRIRKHQPEKAIFMTEFGQSLIGEEINSTPIDFAKMLNQIRNREYVFGASLWTYNDYRSFHRSPTPTWETKVSQNRDWGLVDGYGNKKRAFEVIRKEHAPFKSMKVQQQANQLSVTLQPRKPLDLPAFKLRAYRLVCEELINQQWIKSTDFVLPDVTPGDSAFTRVIPLKNSTVAARRISVYTPTGYAQQDTILYYQAPAKPTISVVYTDGEKIRIQYEPAALATSYKVKYGETNPEFTSPETIDTYCQTDKLTTTSAIGKTYKVQLIAVNSFGETASEIESIKIEKTDVFPPVVKGYRSVMGGLSIGYSSVPNEYMYKIQYSTTSDFSSDNHIIQTSTKGACFIPDLKSRVRYYFRMSSVHQYELQSAWGLTYSLVL